jgi:hypothetical protein
MKYLLPFLLLPILVNSQDSLLFETFPLVDGKVNYTRIIEADSINKEALFLKIKDWATQNYRSQKITLDAEDKDGGFLAYKGYLPAKLIYSGGIMKGKPYDVDVYHTLRFYIKNGKAKIVFTDLETKSHDLASAFISDKNGKEIERVPIELWGKEFRNPSKSKQEKLFKIYTQDAKKLDEQFKVFLTSIEKFITKTSSEFNF